VRVFHSFGRVFHSFGRVFQRTNDALEPQERVAGGSARSRQRTHRRSPTRRRRRDGTAEGSAGAEALQGGGQRRRVARRRAPGGEEPLQRVQRGGHCQRLARFHDSYTLPAAAPADAAPAVAAPAVAAGSPRGQLANRLLLRTLFRFSDAASLETPKEGRKP
jgi:hypothetical protein